MSNDMQAVLIVSLILQATKEHWHEHVASSQMPCYAVLALQSIVHMHAAFQQAFFFWHAAETTAFMLQVKPRTKGNTCFELCAAGRS